MHFFDADGLTGEDLAEINFSVAQTDSATTGDHDGLVVERVVDVGQTGVGARGRFDRPRRDISCPAAAGSFQRQAWWLLLLKAKPGRMHRKLQNKLS